MVKWIALVLALIALTSSANNDDLQKLKARLEAIEGRKCTLMAVATPSGSAWICVEMFGPATRSGEL